MSGLALDMGTLDLGVINGVSTAFEAHLKGFASNIDMSVLSNVACTSRCLTAGLTPEIPPEAHAHVQQVFSDLAATAGTSSAGTSAVAIDYQSILRKASKRALGGGTSGALAGVAQVLSLMWLRTAMNFQYRYGTSTLEAIKTLYEQGGITRLYQGLGFALVQNPISRFGDTAANAGVLSFLEAIPETSTLPLPVKQAVASLAASSWRIGITPIDTFKTTLQVEGSTAVEQLKEKISLGGPGVLWNGAFAAAAATFVGNYPWFLTYNYVDKALPSALAIAEAVGHHDPSNVVLYELFRRASIGIAASTVSDTLSNSLRVIKTAKQTSKVPISYVDVTKDIIDKDGLKGILGRGLGTRLLVNCLQGALFSVVWKYFEKILATQR